MTPSGSKTWFAQSTKLWMASAKSEALPENIALKVLAIAMPKFANKAMTITLIDPEGELMNSVS